MNRAFYIIGIVFSVFFFFIAAFYVGSARSAYLSEMYSMLLTDYSGDYTSSYGSSLREQYTIEGAMWSLFFILSFITFDLMGLIKVKTVTAKVMSIIGLSISSLFLLWDFAVIGSPGSMSYDEVGPAFVLYSIVMLAFTIVGLVQSVRYYKMKQSGAVENAADSLTDLLDS